MEQRGVSGRLRLSDSRQLLKKELRPGGYDLIQVAERPYQNGSICGNCMTNYRAVMRRLWGLDEESLTLPKTNGVGKLVKTLTDARIDIPNSLPSRSLRNSMYLVRHLIDGSKRGFFMQEVHQTPQYTCLTSPAHSVPWLGVFPIMRNLYRPWL
jgi:hypothetical protein